MAGDTKRPSRLLNLKKPNKATKHITERNEEESWFLRLPAEIRNRVYEYAIGGRDLHIVPGDRKGVPLRTYGCKASTTATESVKQWKTSGFLESSDHQHRLCYSQHSPADITVSMLSACRAIYSEAALVPLISNTFILADEDMLLQLNEHLNPTQQRAIREMHLTTEIAPWRSCCVGFTQRSLQHFTGLRTLSLRLEFPSVHRESEKGYEMCWRTFQHLAQGRLESVEVIAYGLRYNFFHNTSVPMPVTKPETVDFAARLKSYLLMSQDELKEKHELDGVAEAKRKRDEEDEKEQKKKKQEKQDAEDAREEVRQAKRVNRGLRSLKN